MANNNKKDETVVRTGRNSDKVNNNNTGFVNKVVTTTGNLFDSSYWAITEGLKFNTNEGAKPGYGRITDAGYIDTTGIRNTAIGRGRLDSFAGYIEGDNKTLKIDNKNGNFWNGKNKWNFAQYNLEAMVNSVGITYDKLLSRILNLESINKNKLFNPVDVVSFGRTYVFFTRPDLHLFMVDGSINPSIKQNCPDLYVKIQKNLRVARLLQSIYSMEPVTAPDKGFIHLLGNMCHGISYVDMSLSQKDAAKNAKGYGIIYGGDFLEAMKETTITIDFYDNRYRDIGTLIEIWTEYIEGLSQGKIYTKRKYRDQNIIDYAISIYILILDETNNIVSHGGYVGCYPRSVNTTLINHKRESLTNDVFMGPFSYEWQATHVLKPNSHTIVEMFNYASGYTRLRNMMDPNTAFGVDFPLSYKSAFVSTTVNRSFGSEAEKNTQRGKSSNIVYIQHTSIEPYGIDIARYDKTVDREIFADYEHQLTITEYWPQYCGITMSPDSSETLQYNLIFLSTQSYLNSVGGRKDYRDIMNYDFYEHEGINRLQRGLLYQLRRNSLGFNPREIVNDLSAYADGKLFVPLESDGSGSMNNIAATVNTNKKPNLDTSTGGRYGSWSSNSGGGGIFNAIGSLF